MKTLIMLCLLVSACDGQKTPEKVVPYDVHLIAYGDGMGPDVYHDDRRNVTCYHDGKGLSCFPDHVIVVDAGLRTPQ